MACRLSRFIVLILTATFFVGCGSGAGAVNETPVEPPPAATATQLQQSVDAAIASPGSGGSVATSVLESASELTKANPGKEKTVSEIQSLANKVMNKEAAGEDSTPELRRMKTLLGELK